MSDIPKYLSKEIILKAINNTRDRRNRLLLNVLWQTGARVSEVSNMKFIDIKDDLPGIKVNTIKRKNHVRVIPITLRLLNDLLDFKYDYKKHENENIFNIGRRQIYTIVKNALSSAGAGPGLRHPHILRHSFAIYCIKNGVNVLALNEWLGHKELQNTLIYSRIAAPDTIKMYQSIKWD